jgi:hypothetical protein
VRARATTKARMTIFMKFLLRGLLFQNKPN